MVCKVCLETIEKTQAAYRIAPDIMVHYRRCKPSVENEIHVTGRIVAWWNLFRRETRSTA